jgi:hypothetical protein
MFARFYEEILRIKLQASLHIIIISYCNHCFPLIKAFEPRYQIA